MKRRKKWTLRRILSLGLALLMIVGAVAGIAALTKRLTADQKTISPTFQRGGIDARTGIEIKTNSSLYSEPFEAKGLAIELDFDAHLSYQIFWYKEDGTFLVAEPASTKNDSWYAPAYCKARIVITPLWNELDDDDGEISWYEVWSYSSKITIRVDKDQDIKRKDFGDAISLTDTFFTKVPNSAYDPGRDTFINSSSSTDQYDDSWGDGCTTYWFTNKGTMSLLYLDCVPVDVQTLHIYLISKEGKVGHYYSGDVGNNKTKDDLPTRDNPLFIPPEASVYIFFDTDARVEGIGTYEAILQVYMY